MVIMIVFTLIKLYNTTIVWFALIYRKENQDMLLHLFLSGCTCPLFL